MLSVEGEATIGQFLYPSFLHNLNNLEAWFQAPGIALFLKSGHWLLPIYGYHRGLYRCGEGILILFPLPLFFLLFFLVFMQFQNDYPVFIFRYIMDYYGGFYLLNGFTPKIVEKGKKKALLAVSVSFII